MRKYKVSFTRLVHQHHEAIVKANTRLDVDKLYVQGLIPTTSVSEFITDENDLQIIVILPDHGHQEAPKDEPSTSDETTQPPDHPHNHKR